MKHSIVAVTVVTLFWSTLPFAAIHTAANETPTYHSQYAGQEARKIKSLSAEDIDELQNGKGWGLAKAAELNGVPGPAHLLEMKDEVPLTAEQVQQIEALYAEMKAHAIPLGNQLIEQERALNAAFADGTITDAQLEEMLAAIADTYRQLRYTHLSTHLKSLPLLTSEQVQRYNTLRGYFSDDPCANIPEGHNPEMWKKHNNCP